MLASELVSKLQAQIAAYGDLEIYHFQLMEGTFEVKGVTYHSGEKDGRFIDVTKPHFEVD